MVVTFVYLLQIYLLLLRTEEQSHVLRYIEGRDCNTIQPKRDEEWRAQDVFHRR
jgi:hypothetical protein